MKYARAYVRPLIYGAQVGSGTLQNGSTASSESRAQMFLVPGLSRASAFSQRNNVREYARLPIPGVQDPRKTPREYSKLVPTIFQRPIERWN